MATRLLEEIDLRPEDITFDSSGLIVIDGTAIPSSNIFLVFPLLFKKVHPSFPGLQELKLKLSEMHLDSFFEENNGRKKIKPESKVGQGNTVSVPNKRWYFIGN